MEQQELISVIIPVYNVEKYLRECIESVLKQTYRNLEIILVDDGSTDSSGVICDEYEKKDNRIRVIHQKNQGLSGARNTGFENAHGVYVHFLDSDDWILPETYQMLMERVKKEKTDFVYFEAVSFLDEEPEKEIEQRYLREKEYVTDEGKHVLALHQKNKEYHSAVQLLFIQKQFLAESKIMFEPDIIYEDMLFTYELFCVANRVTHFKESFYQRRYRRNSIMTSKKTKKNFVSAYTVYDKVRDVSVKLGIADEEFAKQYIIRCAFNTFNYYKTLGKQEKKECLDNYQKFRQNVLENKAFGNKALQMRCYGYVPWVIYKVIEKLFITGMKGKK